MSLWRFSTFFWNSSCAFEASRDAPEMATASSSSMEPIFESKSSLMFWIFKSKASCRFAAAEALSRAFFERSSDTLSSLELISSFILLIFSSMSAVIAPTDFFTSAAMRTEKLSDSDATLSRSPLTLSSLLVNSLMIPSVIEDAPPVFSSISARSFSILPSKSTSISLIPPSSVSTRFPSAFSMSAILASVSSLSREILPLIADSMSSAIVPMSFSRVLMRLVKFSLRESILPSVSLSSAPTRLAMASSLLSVVASISSTLAFVSSSSEETLSSRVFFAFSTCATASLWISSILRERSWKIISILSPALLSNC